MSAQISSFRLDWFRVERLSILAICLNNAVHVGGRYVSFVTVTSVILARDDVSTGSQHVLCARSF